MNKRIISNEEFIELWKTHKSAAKIARLTGISERNVHHRRRDIEKKYLVNTRTQAKGGRK
jgi:DNA-binding CsgD family transcriptional regulator